MRFFLLLSLLSSGIFCVGAEYRSDGFQAKISPKGVLTSLTFRGEKILNLSQLEGACRTPPDKPKGKSVVFRQSDAKNTTEQHALWRMALTVRTAIQINTQRKRLPL